MRLRFPPYAFPNWGPADFDISLQNCVFGLFEWLQWCSTMSVGGWVVVARVGGDRITLERLISVFN